MLVLSAGQSLGGQGGLAWHGDLKAPGPEGWSRLGGAVAGSSTGSYLALGCVGHSPNCSDHGEGAGRLVGVLLPRDRVIGERPITAEGNRRESSRSADDSDGTCPITPQCSAAPSQA